MRTFTCDTCGHETQNPKSDPEVFFQIEFFWHRKCVLWYSKKEGIVNFPSNGMMIPSTIMTDEE